MTKRVYIVPDRLHYDVFRIRHNSEYTFVCSCANETEALQICNALAVSDAKFGILDTVYKTRSRDSQAHTIYRCTPREHL